MNTFPPLSARFTSLPGQTLESSLRLRGGDARDYEALSEHHYRASRPATMTRVLVLEHATPALAARFGSCDAKPQAAGVLVESLPPLNSSLRDWALHERFGSIRDLKARAAVLNREIRCISRVVVHPQWRGLGLAVRLVRAALASATTPVTEAFAAMGHVNPFFERAGMTAHLRPPHAFDRRLIDAIARVGLDGADLALPSSLIARIEAMPATDKRFIVAEFSRWHRQTVGRSRGADGDLPTILRSARQRLLLEPVYYVHVRS
ncbi:MAG: hypothetical protein WD768_21200 [Phycisphaeraceae bacterium]